MKRGLETTDFSRNTRHKAADPSPVLHVRALPQFTTEAELTALCSPYGTVTAVMVLTHKNQGFIQMADVNQAAGIVSSFESNPPSVRGQRVYVQYSSRQQIEKKAGASKTQEGQAGCVLIYNILNATVPITLDNIHQVSSAYGEVRKIITFTKGGGFNALVQFGTAEQALAAKSFLHGKDMFQGCCTLMVSYSNRQQLMVRVNNHKSWDYTSNQPGGGSILPAQGLVSNNEYLTMQGGMGGMMQGGMGGMGMQANAMGGGLQPAYGAMGGDMGPKVLIVNNINQLQVPNAMSILDQLFTLCGCYGDVIRIKILYTKRDTALVQFRTAQQAQIALSHLQDCPLNGAALKISFSKHQEVTPSQEGKNLDEKGNVLTKDFSNSQLHRYRNKAFMNMKNINMPSQVLHVANLSEEVTAEAISQLFGTAQQEGMTPPVVEFFSTTQSQAYVCMASVADAINALIYLHNYTLGRYPIRVSFSRKDPARMMPQAMPQAVPQQQQI